MHPMEIRRQLLATYNAIAEHFDITRYKPWPETMIFAAFLPRGCVIADLGCGNGRNALYLASKGFKVIGIDFSQKLLEIAAKRAEQGRYQYKPHFILGDVVSLPLSAESVDAVLYIATLHHLPTREERLRSVREVERVLRRGGEALISVWAIEQEKFRTEFSRYRIDDMEVGDVHLPWKRQIDGKVFPRYYHFFSKEEFLELFKNSGLRVIEYFYHADNHYVRVRKE